MIIVRSAFDINSFLGNLDGCGIGLLRSDLGFGIILVGSAKILAEASKLYGALSVQYIVADYGDYLFVNRVEGRGRNDRVNTERDFLKTGIKYDIVLAVPYRTIDLSEIVDVPILELPCINSGPIEALSLLDEMFAAAQQ